MSVKQLFRGMVPATRTGLALVGLIVPLVSMSADAPAAAPTPSEKLEWLLATHDVRYIMQASRSQVSECESE
jgi:hypothetical protein